MGNDANRHLSRLLRLLKKFFRILNEDGNCCARRLTYSSQKLCDMGVFSAIPVDQNGIYKNSIFNDFYSSPIELI